jgi:AcrR family transcriptional regulator
MAESTRESLITAASELLDRGGPPAVTLRDVGHAVGVSHNAPYKHFRDKDDLLAAVACRELERQNRIAEEGPGVLTAEAMMLAYVGWARRYPERFRLTFGRWTRDNEKLARAGVVARRRLVEKVGASQAAGQLPAGDPERLSSILLALAHGAADLALSGDQAGGADPEGLVSDLFRYLKPVPALAPALDSDLAAIATLVNASYRGEGGWTHEADYVDGERTSVATLRQDLADQPLAVLLTLRDGATGPLLGVVWLEPADMETWYLGMLTMRSDLQDRKLGRALLAQAEAWAGARGARRIRMTVVNVRDTLIAWYERRGYHRTGETHPFPYEDARFGVPRRDDLEFVVLERELSTPH